jgi:heat-inducible transcriptional repressor
MKLEEDGFVRQQHSSGGRIPTAAAYRLYAHFYLDKPLCSSPQELEIAKALSKQTREVATYLLQAVEKISELTQCAVFLSAPRFDQDFILEIKLVYIDNSKLLCVLITDFGLIRTEILYTEKKLSLFTLKRLEAYFNGRLTGIEKPTLDREEEILGAKLYKELMLRHIVNYTHFSKEELLQAGFSKLLAYSDFNDAAALASGLALFENKDQLRSLLSEVHAAGTMCCWIGEELIPFSPQAAACSVLALPYRIHQTPCGALGILGPIRLPYKELFGQLQTIADALSDSLTKSVYKFKLSFRTREPHHPESLERRATFLLEDKSLKESP